jgi:triacylglycerol lipase
MRISASYSCVSLFLLACGGSDPTSIPVSEPNPAPEPIAEPDPRGAPDPDPQPDSGPPQPDAQPEPTRIVLLVPGTSIVGSYFDLMAERLENDGFTPVVFEPPDLFTESLAIGAERVGKEIDRVLAERGEEKLHVVAECNGGVATRYYLQVLGGSNRVDQVVTFVSAHNGTWLSPVGWISGFQSLSDITPGSAFLEQLNAAPFPPGLKLTSLYSCNDELMLPYDTSVVPGATNVLFCDYYIGHFDGFWDALVYQRIHLALSGEGQSAPTSY